MKSGRIKYQTFVLYSILLSVCLHFNAALGAVINVPSAQYQTIQAGIDAAVNGDTVLVADGTYKGEGNRDLDFKGKAITVISENGPDNSIIDCEGAQGFYFHSDEGENSVLSGFTITNGFDPGLRGAGIDITYSSPVIIHNVIRNNNGPGIVPRAGSKPLIRDNIISDNKIGISLWASEPEITGNLIKNNKGSGIDTANTGAFIITNNTISGNTASGINYLVPAGRPGPVVIANNTILSNSATGISGNRDDAITLSNNIVMNNQGCGIFLYNDRGIPFANYNDVWANAGGNYCDLAVPGTDDISADPLFADPAQGDYHLLPNSPCIDAGTDEGAPDIDFDGDNRPIDGNADNSAEFDIGADETGELLNHDIAVQTMLPLIVPVKSGTNFIPQAKVLNFGSQSENNFTVTCEIRKNSTIVYWQTKTIPYLDSLDSMDAAFAAWAAAEAGEFRLKFYTQLAGDENPDNDIRVRTISVVIFDADFTSDVTGGSVPLAVNFNELSTGDATEWLWEFGDGNQSYERNPTHTYDSWGAYTVSLTISNADMSDTETKTGLITVLPDIFSFEVGNQWTYQGTDQTGTYVSQQEIVSISQTVFPVPTYVLEGTRDGLPSDTEWYEKTSDELKLWGQRESGDFYRYNDGMIVAWYPMHVNDSRESTGTVSYAGYTLNFNMTVDALAVESIDLGFDIFETYKLRYIFRLWGYGFDDSITFYHWVVPYIGFIKMQADDSLKTLTAFSIGEGSITQETDADDDGLKDYQELIFHDTNPVQSDTDHDGMPDGWEVAYGLDPKSDDASDDYDGDGFSNLFEYQRGTDPTDPDDYPSLSIPCIPLLLLEK